MTVVLWQARLTTFLAFGHHSMTVKQGPDLIELLPHSGSIAVSNSY